MEISVNIFILQFSPQLNSPAAIVTHRYLTFNSFGLKIYFAELKILIRKEVLSFNKLGVMDFFLHTIRNKLKKIVT